MNADGTAKRDNLVFSDFEVTSLASVGDIDGDGVGDLAVGVETETSDFGDQYSGAVFVLLLNADGSVKEEQVIGDEIGGGPQLARGDWFGTSVAPIGDIDGDGISDLAVGAPGDDTGILTGETYGNRGAVYVLLMNPDGTAKSVEKIADQTGNGPLLNREAYFGGSVASLGDLDGDGITDIAVGATYDGTGYDRRGAIYVMNLNANGTAKHIQKIAHRSRCSG
jgi:FG-GAP repeat